MECVGGCGVELSGEPDPGKDHGVAMTCGSSACADVFDETLKSIMEKGVVCVGCSEKYERGHTCKTRERKNA